MYNAGSSYRVKWSLEIFYEIINLHKENAMTYEVLEKQIKALPPRYYESLVDYLEYLTKKSSGSDRFPF